MNRKYYVEMYDTNGMVTTEQWEFDTEEEARSFYRRSINMPWSDSDKENLEFILSTHESDGEYIQIDSYVMSNDL